MTSSDASAPDKEPGSEPGNEPGNEPPDPPAHKSRKRKIWQIVAASALAILLVAVVGGVLVYRHLNSNIGTIALPDLGDRPSKSIDPDEEHEPLTILLLGSDTREGEGNDDIGGETPGLSDTTILLHINADRDAAYGVSIPRDSIVRRPDCTKRDGSVAPGGLDLWNAAYAIGGAACTMKQTEATTDVRVDHVVVVDFGGFRTMVDALGGVQVCLPEEVADTESDIFLPEGTYEVDGEQALGYVRERKELGDGSDIGRMKRQQAFMAAMVNKAMSLGTLTNPPRLYRFLDAATKSLSTDEGLASLAKLTGLANQLRGIGMENVKFTTVPFTTYEPDPARLIWTDEADDVWKAMREDQPLPKKQSETATSAKNPDNTGGKEKTQAQIDAALANGLCA